MITFHSKKTQAMNNRLHWKSVLKLIKKGQKIENIVVDFNNENILWKDAMLLGKNGIEVPENIIDYDDENIDYSDIPPIKREDIESGKIKWIYKAEIPIREEIKDWIKHEKIDINKLLGNLVENFYETMKNIHNKAAL